MTGPAHKDHPLLFPLCNSWPQLVSGRARVLQCTDKREREREREREERGERERERKRIIGRVKLRSPSQSVAAA
jgi:hypothetical protein